MPDTDTSEVRTGIVYSETVVWAAPAEFVDQVPYQLAIIDLNDGPPRITARIVGERVAIGDRVRIVEECRGVSYLRKAAGP